MNKGEIRSALIVMVALFISGCNNKKQAESLEMTNTFLAMPEGRYCIRDVSEDDIAGLKELLEAYFKDPEEVGILLKAYTSMSGTIHQNRKAANRRLNGVKQYLIDSGVPAAKIAIDYDPTPMSANKRGVELTIVPKSLVAEIRSMTVKPKARKAKSPTKVAEAAKAVKEDVKAAVTPEAASSAEDQD